METGRKILTREESCDGFGRLGPRETPPTQGGGGLAGILFAENVPAPLLAPSEPNPEAGLPACEAGRPREIRNTLLRRFAESGRCWGGWSSARRSRTGSSPTAC